MLFKLMITVIIILPSLALAKLDTIEITIDSYLSQNSESFKKIKSEKVTSRISQIKNSCLKKGMRFKEYPMQVSYNTVRQTTFLKVNHECLPDFEFE
ncbi:MAG: hypothetical protein AB8E15_01120 [Bdellovibrionales bacterium]